MLGLGDVSCMSASDELGIPDAPPSGGWHPLWGKYRNSNEKTNEWGKGWSSQGRRSTARMDSRALRPVLSNGDPFGTHRSLDPKGALPQPAQRVDNDFSQLFSGELLLAVETLNIDAASFRQMEE